MENGLPVEQALIGRLLRPRSIAIVGASATPGALGNSVLRNLDQSGFDGAIHLVNPKRGEIEGRTCVGTVAELPPDLDVAVLCIPRAGVLEALRALADRRVGAAVIYSAGFAEDGDAGLTEQREIARIACQAGMVVEGPNCLGLINFVDDVPLTFVSLPSPTVSDGGRVGIVSQSGAMAAVIATTLIAKELPLSYFVSTGNEAASSVEDYLEHLLDDEHTQVIALIVEQFRHPMRFQLLARRARAIGKPLILLHPGRSAGARASAATHTGAMAGDYDVMRTLVEDAGVVLCHDLEEIGDVLELAARCGPLQPGTAILAESGALKAMALDLVEEIGLQLPALDDRISPKLRAAMPDFVAVSNPVDLTAHALVDPDLYRRTLSALAEDDRLGSIVICVIQTDASTAERKFPPISRAIEQLDPPKPVIFAGVDDGAKVPQEYVSALRRSGVPYFPSPDRALRAVSRWGRYTPVATIPTISDPGPQLALPTIGGVIPEYQSKALLAPLGLRFPDGRFVTTLDQARAAAAELGWPVAIKAQSARLAHKSDAGGVVLNLRDDASLAAAWRRLHANVAEYLPGVALDGILVEAMSEPGVELIVGARRDPDWGPVVMVGFGGIAAELFNDVCLLPPSLDRSEILRRIDRLRSAPLLHGFRGSPPGDVDALSELIARIGALVRDEPRLREVELNPVVVRPAGQGVIALDALMTIDSRAASA